MKAILSFFFLFWFGVTSSQTTLWSTGFETGNTTPTYSLTTGVSLGLSTTGGNTAAQCGRIVANSSPSKTYDGSIITSNTITFIAGKYYEVIVWAKVATATGRLQIYKNSTNTNAAMKASSGGDIILSSATNNVTTTSYVKYTTGFTVASNESKYIGFQMIQTATASANMFLDDISVIEYNDPQCINYCKPTSSGSAAGHITNVTFNTINRNSTYDGYACTGTATSIQQASSHTISITKTTSNAASITAWVDYNKNGIFESGESIVSFASNSTANQSASITVPGNATVGNTKMRVMYKHSSVPTGPCDATATYYDVEDYDITITEQPACVGTPSPGNTIVSSNTVCPNTNITLSLQNETAGSGITYQWQSSTNNSSWTNESGISSTFSVDVTENKYYRCIVTCSGSSGTSNSVFVTVSLSLSCYGTPTSTTDDATGLTEVVFNTIINPTTGSPAYNDFTGTHSTIISQGGTYQLSVKVNTNGNYTVYVKAWIDWNRDGVFSSSNEEYNLGSVKNVTNSLTNLSPLTIDVPIDASGEIFMRIRATYNVAPTSSGNQSFSEAEDYKLIIEEPTPLPVELLYFEGSAYPTFNNLRWSTASEQNSDYFGIEHSIDGELWNTVGVKEASGNSNQKINYGYSVMIDKFCINYYRLKQVDFDGAYKYYGPISLDNTRTSKKIVKYINLLGQDINPQNTNGVIIIVFDDGTTQKIIR